MVQVTQIARTSSLAEIEIVEVALVEAHLPTVGVGAKKTTITGTTRVTETGGTMIMTTITTEVVQGAIAEVERGDEIVDVIERRGLVEIDHMRSLEIDHAKG
mmetsp:Transcript_13182/g.15075  ORF Transcript_13182/g.15075 Transcript_13182/m.15075 type:complete len:102 (-) Transcript_13182:1947-2252(-)